MKAIKPLLLGVSILALASGAAYAGGDTKNKSASSGASTSASTKYDFNKADTNHDGKVSRAEFDAMMKASASGGGTPQARLPPAAKTSSKPSTSSK